jgi:hypothetical protein
LDRTALGTWSAHCAAATVLERGCAQPRVLVDPSSRPVAVSFRCVEVMRKRLEQYIEQNARRRLQPFNKGSFVDHVGDPEDDIGLSGSKRIVIGMKLFGPEGGDFLFLFSRRVVQQYCRTRLQP